MAQVKKSGMREAILESGFGLFARKGFTATTMADIARGAGMTVGNTYVYFDSKLAIFYAIYRPWLEKQLDSLAVSVRRLRSPREQVRRTLLGLWGDIPAADHCFANALIEALSAIPEGAGKQNDLLVQVEVFISDLLREVLPEERKALVAEDLLAHILWMAFDGFVINQHIGDVRPIDRVVDVFTDLLLPPAAQAAD